MSDRTTACEIPGCKSHGEGKRSVGLFQVYDNELPTMTRPAQLCQGCRDFAVQCGLEPRQQQPES